MGKKGKGWGPYAKLPGRSLANKKRGARKRQKKKKRRRDKSIGDQEKKNLCYMSQ